MTAISRKPYLLRAMHQWITDSGMTPYLVVDVAVEGVNVPPGYAKDGKLVLNVSHQATQDLDIPNEQLVFSARFGGVARNLEIPMAAVLAVYAQETGQGMVFGPEEDPPPSGPETTPAATSGAPRKPVLKVIK